MYTIKAGVGDVWKIVGGRRECEHVKPTIRGDAYVALSAVKERGSRLEAVTCKPVGPPGPDLIRAVHLRLAPSHLPGAALLLWLGL